MYRLFKWVGSLFTIWVATDDHSRNDGFHDFHGYFLQSNIPPVIKLKAILSILLNKYYYVVTSKTGAINGTIVGFGHYTNHMANYVSADLKDQVVEMETDSALEEAKNILTKSI